MPLAEQAKQHSNHGVGERLKAKYNQVRSVTRHCQGCQTAQIRSLRPIDGSEPQPVAAPDLRDFQLVVVLS